MVHTAHPTASCQQQPGFPPTREWHIFSGHGNPSAAPRHVRRPGRGQSGAGWRFCQAWRPIYAIWRISRTSVSP